MRTVFSLLCCIAVGCSRSGPNEGDCIVPAEPAGPVIRVNASYPGANAKVVADVVAAPIEQHLTGVEGLVLLESESRDGTYTATLRFAAKTDAKIAGVLVQNRVNLAQPQLPADVARLGVTVHSGDPDRFPPLWLAIWTEDGKADIATLGKAALELKNAMMRVPGVTDVRVIGQPESTVRLRLDPEKLAVYSLTATDVTDAFRKQSLELAGAIGPVKDQTLEVLGAVALETEKLEGLIVKTLPQGAVIRLKDVGRLDLRVNQDGFARFNNNLAAFVAVVPADAKALDAAIERATKEFGKLPNGIAGEGIADLTNGSWSLVEVQLPDAASREKTEKATAEIVKRVRELPGSPSCIAFGESESRVSQVFVKVAAKEHDALRKAMPDIAETRVRRSGLEAGRPFPVRLALTDEGGHGEEKLREWADAVARRLEKDNVAVDPDVFPGVAVQQTHLNIDREKAAKLGVNIRDIYETLDLQIGEGRLKDFNAFGRSWDVVLQPEVKRNDPDTLKKLLVRGTNGEMVPLGTVGLFKSLEAPPAALRVNLHPAMRITATTPQGKTVAEATAKCVEIAEAVRKEMKLPDAFKVVNIVDLKPR